MPLPIQLSAARTTETPAASMHTYASPTTTPAAPISVWRTEMAPDATGPVHSIDVTHVVVVLAGRLDATVDGHEVRATPGDCVVLDAGVARQLAAGPEGVVTVTAAPAGSRAVAGAAEPVTVPWAN